MQRIILNLGVELARSGIAGMRKKVARVVILGLVATLLAVLALVFSLAAGAVWLSKFMDLWLVLLVFAGVSVVCALVAVFLLRRPGHKRNSGLMAAVGEIEAQSLKIDPTLIIVSALALGFVMSRSKTR